MKQLFALFTLLVLLTGCTAPVAGRSNLARYSSDEQGYTIVLSDRRNLMAHDPISLLTNRTYRVECHIKSKTISGNVDASTIQLIELQDFNGKFRLRTMDNTKGNLSFDGKTLTVDLWVKSNSTGKSLAYEFNGIYQLERITE